MKNNAYLNYQVAWSFDILEKETDAIYYYEKAISLNNLEEKDLKEAMLALASTYRSIGKYNKAKELFEIAIEKWDDNSLKSFFIL